MIKLKSLLIGPIWIGIGWGNGGIAVGFGFFPLKKQLTIYMRWIGSLPILGIRIC